MSSMKTERTVVFPAGGSIFKERLDNTRFLSSQLDLGMVDL